MSGTEPGGEGDVAEAKAPARGRDDQSAVVRQYAEALLGAAVKEGRAEAVLDDLDAIEAEVLGPNPEFARILASAKVPAAHKDRMVGDVFGPTVDGLTLRFLRILNRRGRLDLIAPLVREARQLWDRRHGRIPVDVVSAVPLDEGQQSALREGVARMISATPILRLTVDPSLIGGLVVQVGDQVCDASVRNRLEQLRQRLIEGKTHEIQSRRDQFSHPA